MKRAVLISIQPKWVNLIASGKKTVELRTTRPKEQLPFKCYIYCTQGKGITDNYRLQNNDLGNGKVIGEFWCDTIDEYTEKDLFAGMDELNNNNVESASCVDIDDILQYKGNRDVLYGWHIKGLMIYDTPKPLSAFGIPNNSEVQNCKHREQCYTSDYSDTGYLKAGFVCNYKEDWCTKCKRTPLTRAPQSWGYAEEIKQDVPR